MQIQLKQREIEAALKMFISQQGISLVGKAVAIEFTSGRKDNGLSAELTIEDAVSQTTTTCTTVTTTAPVAALDTDTAPAEEATKPVSLFNK